ncbi:MAG: class I SAM-dependent methyltransferase [Alphaproteobacteria bacterium]
MAGEAFSQREVKAGRLSIRDADGSERVLQGAAAGPHSAIRIHDERFLRKMMFKPDLFMGEGYMDGTLEIVEGTLYDFLEFCGINMSAQHIDPKLSNLFRKAEQKNVVGKAKQNVAHHYDLDGGLYEHFLDEDKQYSCAYFESVADSLETAQANKKRHIAGKLLLEPGMKVLDIGSGWGGMALYLAQIADVEVLGVTLSEEQLKISQARAEAAGLAGRVSFELIDYREVDKTFDRIVSVGMFEHVGAGNYGEFFDKVDDLLTGEGVCLLHSIGRKEPPGLTHAWITKYIFPGGYSPSLSETLAAVETSGMWATDIEILRLHYARTLHEWNKRFQENRAKVRAIYDERFCRMWEFYLQSCEVGFRRMGWMVFQLQLAKSVDAVPITRDYIASFEAVNR